MKKSRQCEDDVGKNRDKRIEIGIILQECAVRWCGFLMVSCKMMMLKSRIRGYNIEKKNVFRTKCI